MLSSSNLKFDFIFVFNVHQGGQPSSPSAAGAAKPDDGFLDQEEKLGEVIFLTTFFFNNFDVSTLVYIIFGSKRHVWRRNCFRF